MLRHAQKVKTFPRHKYFLFPFPFYFLLTVKVKNTVYLGNGYIWLQLVESFSNLGLYLSEELLTVEPARGTGYQTILLKKQHNALKRNARTHPRHTSSPVLIKQNHQWVPTSGGEKTPAVYLLMSTESENLSSLFTAGPAGPTKHYFFKACYATYKKLKAFRAIFPFFRFLSVRLWSNRDINLLPPPPSPTWGRNPGYLTCWCTRKKGNWTTVIATGWRIWWYMGWEEDWNKLSQFYVNLFLVLLKCNS